jgi:hypothetical protein
LEAASQNNSANATSPANFAVRGGSRRSRRLPLAQLLFVVASIVLLVAAGSYVFRFVSATAFHKERAFRVLDEFGSQLDNLQRTLANQLRLLPTELVSQQCLLEFAGQSPSSRSCGDRRDSYQRRLALQGPKVGIANVDKNLFARACGQTNRHGMTLQIHEPGVPFTAFSCAIELPSRSEGRVLTASFQGSVGETVESFVSQTFFDEVLVALGDGTVIATVPRQVETASPTLPLHAVKMRRLGVTNVATLLRSSDTATDNKAATLPTQPDVLTTTIAGDNYRAFVRAVQPRIGIYQEQEEGKPALREERLYLVGLQGEDLRAELASSMEPGGRFLLTILTLLAFLVWPLANLRSKSPDDTIAWSEAVACLASVVLIPAVLAIAAVWVWSYQSLLSWVDAGASRYAQQIDTTLNRELQEGRVLLDQYRALYRPSRPSGPVAIPIRSQENGFVTGHVGACNKQQDRTCVIDVPKDGAGEWRSWTTFSSVFATDSRGIREGDRYTVYDPPMVKSDASYDNREYFRALQRHEGWAFSDPGTGKKDSFVAQRLFSGSDGARVLQIAMPRSEGAACSDGFCGIVTGSASFHSLSASVSPPLLSFAVIDRNNGLVLFHSNDSRSLAENLFVETERNPELLALTEVGQSGFFSGHYVGAGHRFYHLPMKDTPWSVVVFYSLKEVGDLPWHAVFTALAAYTGALLVLFSASGSLVWLWAKRSRKSVLSIAAGFWMRGGSSCSYARWGVALFGAGLCLVTIYEIWADGPVSLITRVMWVLLAVASGAVLLQHRFGIHSVCITLWLLLVSALPAGWMALGYHDVQVQGLLRDGLLGAARDVQKRSAVIASDLQRWLSSNDDRENDFPPVAKLARPSNVMPVPGYASGSCKGEPAQGQENTWALCVFDEPPLATLITRRDLDFWRRETWDASVQAQTQQRRIRLLGRMNGWNPVCHSRDTAEQCVFRTTNGQSFTIRAEAAPGRDTAHDDDDRRFEGVAGSLSSVLALLAAVFVTWMLSFFISRRLLGTGLHKELCRATVPASAHHGVLFYSRKMSSEEVDRLLTALRSGEAEVTRINVAAKSFHTALTPDRAIEGRVLLTNLDIALADAARRRDLLDVLERLVDDSHVQLLILCRRSPIEQLYHPERYPEAGPQHALAVEESLRWDNVLQKFECRDLENTDVPRSHPHLATVDHHRTWKLCSRTERLLLYELARGRLANPRNTTVIEALLARGLLQLDPWPKIADESFEKFVRTAETTEEVAQWQDANQDVGKRWRSIFTGILLAALLLAVLWFSWSGGDKFKVVYAILAGAVAFLSQIGQAFNFVRGGSGTRAGG